MNPQLLEAVAAAKHDLGKYVAFSARWLPPGTAGTELLEALRSDVLHTRRNSDGSEDAVALWSRLRPDLGSLGDDPDLLAVDAAIEELSGWMPGLEAGTLGDGELTACAGTAKSIATHLAALHRRLKAGG